MPRFGTSPSSLKFFAALVIFLPILTGCSTGRSFDESPQVDMRGVDAQKLANDQAECREYKRANEQFIQFGDLFAQCLKKKGYTTYG